MSTLRSLLNINSKKIVICETKKELKVFIKTMLIQPLNSIQLQKITKKDRNCSFSKSVQNLSALIDDSPKALLQIIPSSC